MMSSIGDRGADLTTIQQLKAAHRSTPFRPFTVHMADGRSFPVPHVDFLFTTPIGRTAIICQDNDEMSILDLLLMTEIQTSQSDGSKS